MAVRVGAPLVLASGAGLRKFQEVIELQGGDPRVIETYLGAAKK